MKEIKIQLKDYQVVTRYAQELEAENKALKKENKALEEKNLEIMEKYNSMADKRMDLIGRYNILRESRDELLKHLVAWRDGLKAIGGEAANVIDVNKVIKKAQALKDSK